MRRPATALGVLAAATALAHAGTIDFESVGFGSYTSITLPAGGGTNATFAPFLSAGTVVGVTNIAFLAGRPGSWGNQALTVDSYIVNFSSLAFNEAEIDFSYTSLKTGTASYEVWSGANGTGTLLDSGTQAFTGNLNLGQYASFSISTGQAFGSLRFSDSLGQMVWDNLTLRIIPLPHAGGLAAAGLGLLALRRRRTTPRA